MTLLEKYMFLFGVHLILFGDDMFLLGVNKILFGAPRFSSGPARRRRERQQQCSSTPCGDGKLSAVSPGAKMLEPSRATTCESASTERLAVCRVPMGVCYAEDLAWNGHTQCHARKSPDI